MHSNSDGIKGRILYRGYTMEQLLHDHVYEDIMHLLLWGAIPSKDVKQRTRKMMNSVAVPPRVVIDAIEAYP